MKTQLTLTDIGKAVCVLCETEDARCLQVATFLTELALKMPDTLEARLSGATVAEATKMWRR